ncbi:hypothetical protein DFH09DRAFT_1328796 [Mycena vulgaris]|nr:hypothetical protein DFH09DRAFT_1328796 [Mycena vulgaris]
MDQDHIQTPQELVNHIIDFLHDTTTALKACALVSRAFVHSAQSHIFKELSIGDYGVSINKTTTLWSRCQETLHTSPHLVQHIHRLTLVPDLMSLETFSTICNFLFTHLKEVCIRDFTLAPPLAIALQQLFSLPTLRFVSLGDGYGNPSTFMQIWEGCAPALDFTAWTYEDPTIDLSTFPRLVLLRISIEGDFPWPMVLNTLSTIAPSNSIRQIMICGVLIVGIAAEELDSRLSKLPMHHSPAFHFEMDPDKYDRFAPTLHRLSSTDMLRCAERHHDSWFQNYTRNL